MIIDNFIDEINELGYIADVMSIPRTEIIYILCIKAAVYKHI